MSTGTIIFIVVLALILAFGAVMIWRTFHKTARRRGSETDVDFVNRQARDGESGGRHEFR